MIISRAPVRFSLGGGGTDIPAYYEQFGGYLIASAIDKYIYVSANKRFYDDIRLSYSKTENVPDVDKVEPAGKYAVKFVTKDFPLEGECNANAPNGSHLAMYDDQQLYFGGLIDFLRGL